MILFKGSGVALVTPFKDNKPDFDAMEKLIERQLRRGTDAIISCGTTGEASTLTDEEHIAVVKFAVDKVNGRVPVIGGSGSNDTNHALEMSKALADVGVDGLLIVTPYYNKCSQTGLIKHYTHIADNVDVPLIMYSVPGRTGVNLLPSTVKELAPHPMICGVKEAGGDIAQCVAIAAYIDDDFALYAGNDDMTVPMMAIGGSGVISTVANIIPYEMHLMTRYFFDGEIKKAAELQIKYKPVIDAMFFEVNPIPSKAALNIMGLIEREYRLPLCEPSNKSLYDIMKVLTEFDITN